jgi:hypothetical protein
VSGARRAGTAAAAALAALATGCLSKPSFECSVDSSPSRIIQMQIGFAGGGGSEDVDCGDRAVVGLGFTLTRTPEGGLFENAVVTASLRCATIANHGDGLETGSAEDSPAVGGFSQNIAGPFFASCPDNQVVIGLSAHLVRFDSLFNSVVIHCAALSATGASTGAITSFPVTETGTNLMMGRVDARCTGGEALHGIEARSGSMLDQLRLSCGGTACALPPCPVANPPVACDA